MDMTGGLVSDSNVIQKENTMVETTTRDDSNDQGWPEELEPEAAEVRDSHAALGEGGDSLGAAVRLEQFRRAHEVVTLPVEELEAFSADLIRQAQDQERAKGRRTREPEVFSAADELAAVKYAREQGFITALEAQRKVRKLLRLAGKRKLADRRPTRRRAR